MKCTLNWLREHVPCDLPAADVAHRLTMLGLEVDAVEELFPYLDKVVVARIQSVAPHPDADRLVLCQADTGGETVQVVCGAPNARPGMCTALALPGARLPEITIRKSKIRGQQSAGMFCSARELGLGTGREGIMELDPDAPVGTSLRQYFGLVDTGIEIDLTPNRPDCTAVIGLARELAGSLGVARCTPPVAGERLAGGDHLGFTVEVVDGKGCPRYAARRIDNVRVAPSPPWLQGRLLAAGVRPINNVVDITNYVMLEYGQPLHAFDLDLLAGPGIVVRRARAGETITTLDGVERRLDPEMLLICDTEKPVAVAGVMGGANSEVGEATTSVLLEAACFEPVSIRRTSRKLGLSTDASYRFERGVDPQLAPVAMARAVALLEEICGGEAMAGGWDVVDEGLPQPPVLDLRLERVRTLLGIDIDAQAVGRLLAGIEIPAEVVDDGRLRVPVPSFRVDLEREVDLIEEVARLVGYNEIPATLPSGPLAVGEEQPHRILRRRLATTLASLGFWEAVNYSFIDPAAAGRLGVADDDRRSHGVRLQNPLAENMAVLRTTILPGLLANAAHNINRQENDVRLFEIGTVFLPRQGEVLPEERLHLGVVLSGRRNPAGPTLHATTHRVDFYDIRGVAETLVEELRLAGISFRTGETAPYLEEGAGLTMVCDDRPVGCFGRLADPVAAAFGLRQECFVLELDLHGVLGVASQPLAFRELPRHPAVSWDLAVVVDEEVGAGALVDAITGLGESLVEAVDLFDVYRGKPLADGEKSVALSIRYRSPDTTLDDETVARVHQRITETVLQRFGARLRGEVTTGRAG